MKCINFFIKNTKTHYKNKKYPKNNLPYDCVHLLKINFIC